MKHIKFRWTLWLLLILPGLAKAQEGFVVDEIIAKVDNYIVLKSDLDRIYQDYIVNGGTPGQEARCQYLAILIRNKLMMAKAEIDSVVVLDAEVDANTQNRMEMIVGQSDRTVEELEQLYGKTMEQIRTELRDQIREQMVVSKMENELTKEIRITPSDVRRFFNRIPQDSLPYFSASVEVAQIVRKAKVSDEQKLKVQTQLNELRNRLLQGEDWGKLAKEFSDDPSAQRNGGEMGISGRGRMVPEYEAMAFKLKVGDISPPFESPFGYHIMQLQDRRGNEYASRHILISPKPSPQDLDDAAHFLDSIADLIRKDSITFERAAREFSEDISTKGSGGYFSDTEGNTRIIVDEIDPVVYFRIDSMKTGTISDPIVYRTDDGKDAVRILYYKSRIAPHQASLNDDWSRIQRAALEEKKNNILQKWFTKARKDVFINIDPSYNFCGILD